MQFIQKIKNFIELLSLFLFEKLYIAQSARTYLEYVHTVQNIVI